MGAARTTLDLDVADELRYKYGRAFNAWITRSKDLFVLFDRDFRVTYANPTFCRTFGLALEATRSVGLDDIDLQREATAKWRELLLKTIEEGKEQASELWLPTRDGLRCFRMRVVPDLRMAGGAIESLWVNGRDVTGIRGAQSVIGETETRFQAIVSNVPGLVFQLSLRKFDQSLEFHYVSDGSIALCGIAPDRMAMTPGDFFALIHDDDREEFHRSMRLSLDTLANWAWEGRVSGSVRGERWVSLQATPRRATTNSVLWDGIMLDVTDSRRNAEKLRVSEEALRTLCVRVAAVREEEKRAIAHEIHDELGQLLTALKLDLSCLREGDGLNPLVLSKVRRMEGLADDILHRVRDIASTLRPKVLDLGLAPAVEWLAQEFTYRAGIACHLAMDGLDLCVDLDSARTTAIFRIVQESLTNVARHAHAHRRLAATASGEPALVACLTGPMTMAWQLAGPSFSEAVRSGEEGAWKTLDFAARIAVSVAREFLKAGANVLLLLEDHELPTSNSAAFAEWKSGVVPLANVARFHQALPLLVPVAPGEVNTLLDALPRTLSVCLPRARWQEHERVAGLAVTADSEWSGVFPACKFLVTEREVSPDWNVGLLRQACTRFRQIRE